MAEERKDFILELLNKDGSVKVAELQQTLNVSIETIRRDLESLEKIGCLKRVYGGAISEKRNVTQFNYIDREVRYIEEKKEIAKIAIRYINEGDSIALNNSTTTIRLAIELKNHFEDLTVITNSLKIANELVGIKSFRIILTGGILNSKEYAFYGDITESILSKFSVDKCFIGVSGISLSKGITDYLSEEVQIEKKIIEISQEVIALADSSKFESISLMKVTDLNDINLIISDSSLKSSIVNEYITQGVNVVNA